METEKFVKCFFCENKEKVNNYVNEVFKKGWYEINIINENGECIYGGYICNECFLKILNEIIKI